MHMNALLRRLEWHSEWQNFTAPGRSDCAAHAHRLPGGDYPHVVTCTVTPPITCKAEGLMLQLCSQPCSNVVKYSRDTLHSHPEPRWGDIPANARKHQVNFIAVLLLPNTINAHSAVR